MLRQALCVNRARTEQRIYQESGMNHTNKPAKQLSQKVIHFFKES